MTTDAKTCECGKPVLWAYTCHTYSIGGKWKACLPCDSAIEFRCADWCWSYTWGLNPRNPRVERNEQHRPDWLTDIKWGKHGAVANMPAGVADAWDYEGDE